MANPCYLSGILLGSGGVQAALAQTHLMGGQLKGGGILKDPYDIIFTLQFDGAGDVSGTLEKGVIFRTLPLSGSGTIAESVPLPLYGRGDLASYLDVVSIPTTCPCLCPPTIKTFRYGQAFQSGDLSLCVLDGHRQHYTPTSIYYTLYQVTPSGTKLVVGPYRRTPSQRGIGTFYATGVAGELGQPGEWRIVWNYAGLRGPVQVEQPYQVTASALDPSCGCAPNGWD